MASGASSKKTPGKKRRPGATATSTRRAPVRKTTKKPRSARKRSAPTGTKRLTRGKPVSRTTRKVRPVLEKTSRAFDLAKTRADELLLVCEEIGSAAAMDQMNQLIGELRDQKLLRDILSLQDAMAQSAPGSLPESLEPLRLVPQALLQWLEERFGLTPHLAIGEPLELPHERLSGFEVEGPAEVASHGLVRAKVLTPGWKRNGKPFVRPIIAVHSETGMLDESSSVQ